MSLGSSEAIKVVGTAPQTQLPSKLAPVRAAHLPRKCQFTPEQQPMSVVVVQSAAELAAHLPAWEKLARQTIEPNIFYEPLMLLPALEGFGQTEPIRIVLLYTTGPSNEGSKPILCGLFPLVLRRGYKGLPLRYSSFWKYKYSVLCTPLIHAEYAADCFAAFCHWLETTPETGAFLKMDYIGGDDLFNQLLTDYFNESRNQLIIEERINRALLVNKGGGRTTGEEYINTALSGKRRKELRRQEKLLREQGQLDYVELAPEDDAESWFAQFLQLEAKGWKGSEGSALASAATSRTFFLATMRAAHAQGQLQMLALRLNGRPLAMKCNLRSGAGAFAFKIAFDEEFASYSPGVHLELENIRRLHESTDLHWMDSCATAKHFMINRLWLERRTIKTLLVATGKQGGNFILAFTPLLRWFKRKFLPHVLL